MTRLLVGLLGAAATAYGLVLLLERAADLPEVGAWLVAGVVLHDGVLAPLVLGLGWVAGRLLPARGVRAAVVAIVVTGSLTLLALPVVSGRGVLPDNPTLLDRPYAGSLAVLWALTLAGVALAHLRRPGGSGDGTRPRRG